MNLVAAAGSAGEAPGRLTYSLLRGGQVLVDESPLGIETTEQTFTGGLSFVSETARSIDETYTMLLGKRAVRHVVANEQTLRFVNRAGARLEIDVRVQDDGAAFRYRLLGQGSVTVTGETTGFQMTPGGDAFMAPYDLSGLFQFGSHEIVYRQVEVGDEPVASGWGYPALFADPDSDGWVLISEAGLDESYCGTRLAREAPNGLYRVRFPAAREEERQGEVNPTATMPLTTPWRVLIAGDIATVVESTLVDDLSPPSELDDTSWIVTGRAAWSWLTQDTGDEALQREYLASAVEYGWEHLLIDTEWQEFEDAVPAFVQDARASGVNVHLWYNSGGPNNAFFQYNPRDRMYDRDVRRAEMARIRDWGVAGIKLDFFQSDKQGSIQRYIEILRDAADFQLMVNLHGATVPRGWQRTFPHLVTIEAVAGAELYRFPLETPNVDKQLMLVFARNVVGSMDFTPVVFQEMYASEGVPYVSSLAQAVLFESGITHFGGRADSAEDEGYRAVFSAYPYVQQFMMDVPSTWDETRLLSGDPRSHAVLARRSGEVWYIAALVHSMATLEQSVSLDFLNAGDYEMSVISRGESDQSFSQTLSDVTRASELSLDIGSSHAAVVVIRPR